MGCGGSRPEPDDEVPPALRPFWRRLQELKRSRLEDLRRRRRERKDSVVSTSEVLHPVESNTIEEKSNWKAEEEEDGRIERESTAADERPGSPSFRFYLPEAGKGGGHDNPVRGHHQGDLFS